MSCKDGSPEMIGLPGLLNSKIFGPLREAVLHANNALLAKLNTKQTKKTYYEHVAFCIALFRRLCVLQSMVY